MQRSLRLITLLLIGAAIWFSATLYAQRALSANATAAPPNDRYILVPMNFEYEKVKWSTLVLFDTQTAQSWALKSSVPQQQPGQPQPVPVWQWTLLPFQK